MSLVLEGATLITMNPSRDVLRDSSLLIEGGKIVAIGKLTAPPGAERIEGTGCVVLPGFVQAHTHLCQTLCRGSADELPLFDWLTRRIWPYEAVLDERAMRACVRLAAAELLLSGTTAILDMATVHETDVLFDELSRIGLRATSGKCMMDLGDDLPNRLREESRRSIDESDALFARWHGAAEGRLRYAYAPRFVLSCSEPLLCEVAERVKRGARLHTHASEQIAEVELVRKKRGTDNILYLEQLGLTGSRTALAHCVHATLDERRVMAQDGTHVVHCPSANLKLGSGIAPIPEMLAQGIQVALGADGAPCNNNLDALLELRLAALLHQPRCGPKGMSATQALELATLGGARALGLEAEIGSLEIGKRADVVVLDLQSPHSTPSSEPVSAVVYAAQSRNVRDVIIDGRLLVRRGTLTEATGLEHDEVVKRGREEAKRVEARVI